MHAKSTTTIHVETSTLQYMDGLGVGGYPSSSGKGVPLECLALNILRHGYVHISTTIVWYHCFDKYLVQKIISSYHRKYKLPECNN